MGVKAKLMAAVCAAALAAPAMAVNANPTDLIQQSMTMRACIDLNVRAAEGTDSAVIGNLSKGELVDVIGNDGIWYAIEYGDSVAYAYGEYLAYVCNEDGSFDEGLANEYPGYDMYGNNVQGTSDNSGSYESDVSYLDIMMSASYDVNMRSMPSTQGSIVGVLPAGKDIHVVSTVNGGAWYHCEYNGQVVYVSSQVIFPDFPQTMEATGNVNVRINPNTSQSPIGMLNAGTKVKVSGYENGWLKFKYEATGQAAYVYSSYMEVAQ